MGYVNRLSSDYQLLMMAPYRHQFFGEKKAPKAL